MMTLLASDLRLDVQYENVAQLDWRQFGTVYDDLNWCGLSTTSQAISSLLHLCLEQDPSRSQDIDIDQWTVQKRTQALIDLALASAIQQVDLQCVCPSCSEKAALPLRYQTFQQKNIPSQCEFNYEDSRYVVRMPSDEDQRCFFRVSQTNSLESEMDMSVWWARCLVKSIDGETPPNDWMPSASVLSVLETALQHLDPLNDITLNSQCPNCDSEFSVEFDLEQHLIHAFRRKQQHLMQQVHLLALHYHWSEKTICDLPEARRNAYLQMIGTSKAEWL